MALLHLLITKTPLKARISGLFSYFQRVLYCIVCFFWMLFFFLYKCLSETVYSAYILSKLG